MLQLIHTGKNYKKKTAVEDLNLEISQGDILGLIGSNGAGKSTTLSMIATLMKPDKGDILYKGVSITEKPGHIRRELGYVPQEIALYMDLTGLDNLKFWGRAYHLKGNELKKRIEEAAEITGLDADILKEKVKNYSGGMKRRLNIGAALLHRPKLIIMDEPTVGIDLVSRNRIQEAVERLHGEGATIICTGHYMEEMERLCSRFCVLEAGKIAAEGSKEELLEGGNRTLEQFLFTMRGAS